MGSRSRTGRPVKTTERSFEIISELKAASGLTLDGIAEATDMSRSTAHRHVATLEDIGCVVRENGEFTVSLWFLTYGTDARDRTDLYRVGREHADRLAAAVGETVWIDAKEVPEAVIVYKATGDRLFQSYADVGMRFRLHQIAGGKAILATMSDAEILEILDTFGLPAETDRTITDREELLTELERIRTRGYAIDVEESVPGVSAIASPVEIDDDTVGSLAIAGSADRLGRGRLETELAEPLIEATKEIEYSVE